MIRLPIDMIQPLRKLLNLKYSTPYRNYTKLKNTFVFIDFGFVFRVCLNIFDVN